MKFETSVSKNDVKPSWLRSGRQRTPYHKPMKTKLQRLRAMQPLGIDLKAMKKAFVETNRIVAELGQRQPTCAICLGNIEIRCFLNECLHSYCLECLADWSKEKKSCPTCNQSFSSAFYNFRSVRTYHRVDFDHENEDTCLLRSMNNIESYFGVRHQFNHVMNKYNLNFEDFHEYVIHV